MTLNRIEMTKKEAIEAMKEGKQVTHTTFLDVEFIGMRKNYLGWFIYDENGYAIPEGAFWKYRVSKVFNDGWRSL